MEKVHLIFENQDMTEGRGPMILHTKNPAFSDLQKAKDYIDQQPGVMGRKYKWSEEKYGDWQIRTVEVK